MNELKIVSLNCRGLNNSNKRRDALDYLGKTKGDIYCLQDVHWNERLKESISLEWNGSCYISPGTSNSRGVAILISAEANVTVDKIHCDSDGNLIALVIKTLTYCISLVVIYGPNDDTPDFFKNILTILEDFGTPHCIIVGDWNLVIDPSLDTFNYLHVNNPRARQMVLNMQRELNLYDVWRVLHPDDRHYTWRQRNPVKQVQLDFFLVSSGLLNTVLKLSISSGYRTDHSLISTTFNLRNIKVGRGVWKFNNSLLDDDHYVKMVKDLITETVGHYACFPYVRSNICNIAKSEIQFVISDQLFFEMLLCNIRGRSVSFSSYKKRSENNREKYLINELDRIDPCYHESEDTRTYIDQLNHELEVIRDKKLQGCLVRARADWVEHGEKPPKFFLNLEKRNYVSKIINHLEAPISKISTIRMIYRRKLLQ
ncbi:LINE-1 reverse transcriptase-like [Holothuria leucospilota]|uniref:exodeoxyribonuclease III n=1 Tax=Holothuria leucospilota TaxID=206669 RepID=A0A9Q1H8G8_HOLLE|nr:LINE-1 reverse transcriptase-like [Holothuria leucospilota]